MRRLLALCVLLTLGLVACDSSEPAQRAEPPPARGDRAGSERRPPSEEAAPPRVERSSEEQLIQAWLAALSTEDYRRAASYFARGALIDQGDPHRLRSRAQALEFNRRLPCSAHLSEIVDEGRTTLATFLLSAGPGGSCDGSVQVRFTIRRGKFVAFRQLLGRPTGRRVEA